MISKEMGNSARQNTQVKGILDRQRLFPGAISINRCKGSNFSLNGRSALRPSRTGASASVPETRSVGIRRSVSEPTEIVVAATRLDEICPPPTSRTEYAGGFRSDESLSRI